MRHLIPGLLAVGLALAGMAEAQALDGGMVKLETADDARGWDAVGKLIMGKHGFCTGALIGPQLVLTAAHCLYDKTTGVQMRPEEMEFQAGFRNGRAVAYRRISRAVTHPDYRYGATDKMERVSGDLALLELSQPIRLPSLEPFETGASPVQGDAVDVVSYAQYREEAPTIQQACEVLADERKALILTCSVDFGSSGAPVFTFVDGVARVVSVISAKAEVDGRKVSVAVPLAEPLVALRAALEDSRADSFAGAKKVTVLSGGTGAGAKFVRP